MGTSIAENKFDLIEKYLEKLDAIVSTKFVLDENDQIEELHIVSNGRRNPKQISRDVQSVLIASHKLDIDYKKISIAEIPDLDFNKKEIRLSVGKLTYENRGTRFSVTITLKREDLEYSTTVDGLNTRNNIDRMIVEATLKTIEKFYNFEDVFVFEDIRTLNLTGSNIIVVLITCLLNDVSKTLSGSCVVETDSKVTIVKAVLDALNRYISNK